MSRVAVLVVSDRAARGERPDQCLAVIRRWAEKQGHAVVADRLVADEEPLIERALLDLCATDATLVLTSGGTGLGPRDVTPEATRRVIDRPTPGIDETLRRLSYDAHPAAALSRAVSGLRGETLVINLPGSPRAVEEQLVMLDAFLSHGLAVMHGAGHE